MNARVKNLKLQAKAATMIIAPKKASALECVVATKPLPVRRRSSVGVRREGRASRILFSGGVRCGVQPLRRRVAWVKSTRSTGFCLERSSRAVRAVRFDGWLSRDGKACRAGQRVHPRCVSGLNAIDDLLASGL